MTTAAETAKGLNTEEWAALEYIQTNGSYLINDEDEPLTNFDRVFLKGLLNKIYNQGIPRYFLNVYGNAVLETRASAPVAGKPAADIWDNERIPDRVAMRVATQREKRDESAVDELLFGDYEQFVKALKAEVEDTTHQVITVKDFFDDGYASKQALGQCIVWRSKEQVEQIITMSRSKVDGMPIEVIKPKDGHIFESSTIDEIVYIAEWLTPPQPATPQAANETAEGSEAGDDAIQARALDMVSTQWVQLHQLISEALGLEFLPNEDIERYEEAIKALRDQNTRLQVLCGRAADVLNTYSQQTFNWTRGTQDIIDDLRKAAEGVG